MDIQKLHKQLTNRVRYDYFLVWGHGMDYLNEIVNILDKDESIEIVKIIKRTLDVKTLINAVYSYDYAPVEHLVAKTKYLLQMPPSVAFIFIKNLDADEYFAGEGEFRHIESRNIKRIKEEIRNIFNPRIEGKRTEDHVIHASDNELQTDYILKFLGYSKGVNVLMEKPNPLLDIPSHLPKFNKFEIKEVDAKDILCNIIEEGENRKLVPITETPHYKSLTKGPEYYQKYLDKFSGVLLTDNHSVDKLMALKNKFTYNQYKESGNYILTKKNDDKKYIILDGVHRASVLCSQGVNKFIISIIK